MLSFECIKNEKSVYFLLTSAICPNEPGVIEVLPKRFYLVK